MSGPARPSRVAATFHLRESGVHGGWGVVLVVIWWVGEMITRTSTYSTLNSNMCASSSSYFEPASATRSGIARIKSPKWGASEPRVDTRAWALLICRADRPNLGLSLIHI